MIRSIRPDRCSTLIALALIGWAAGCIDSTPGADGQSVHADIGATGGSLGAAGVLVTFPPGALAETTRITLTPLPAEPSDELVGNAIELAPDGLAFAAPVALELGYRLEDLPAGGAPENLRVAVLEDAGWVDLADSQVDTARRTVSATTMHFSRYGVRHRAPATAEVCTGGVDDDGDGAVDCQDPDCHDDAEHCDCTPAGELLCCLPRCGAGETLQCLGENICGYPCSCVASAAQWYLTCGDPVCRGWTGTSDIALCTTERVGDACDPLGAMCDPKDDCNARLLCATSDPTQQPGGCPISRREVKDDIRYLDQAELLRVLDRVLATRLATWRYRWEPERERLGFIIDDQPGSPAVDARRDMVDLYGFTSQAIGAIQAQALQIERLQQRLDALERQCAPSP